jgi:hypothetical protein
MNKYNVWVRISNYGQTTNVIIHANNDYEAKLIAEAQYGQGNVLGYTLINENSFGTD